MWVRIRRGRVERPSCLFRIRGPLSAAGVRTGERHGVCACRRCLHKRHQQGAWPCASYSSDYLFPQSLPSLLTPPPSPHTTSTASTHPLCVQALRVSDLLETGTVFVNTY